MRCFNILAVLVLTCSLLLSLPGCEKEAGPIPAVQGDGDGSAPSRAPHGLADSHVGFATDRKLVAHYEKHGSEFGRISMQEYLRMAQELRDRPTGGDVREIVRPDGVVTRYDRASGAFLAFNQDGVIRTFFRPADGEAYFLRQARRQK